MDLLALFDREQRIGIEFPDMRKDSQNDLVRLVRPAPGMSFILFSHLDETNANEVIQRQIDYFQEQQQPFTWKAYDHDPPLDLKARLQALGFIPDEREAVMVLDLQSAPEALLKAPQADVRPIAERDQLVDVIQVEERVWGGKFDWITQRLGDHLRVPGYINVYAAYADGEPACAGWVYFHPNSQFASLWGGSTVAEQRGRGLYTAVLAARVQEAARRGRRYLVIDASPMSRPIVANHGFRLLTYAQDFNWKDNPE